MLHHLRLWLAMLPAFLPLMAQAQTPAAPEPARPRLDSIAPCGARLGTSVDCQLVGADLDEVRELLFSHPGIRASVLEVPESKPDPKQAVAPKMAKPAKPSGKFKVAVDASVVPGMYQIWAVNKLGVSNSRVFVVGDLNEVQETEPNNDVPQAQKIALDTTVNGGFASATDVDYYSFAGRKGQRVLAHCRTGSIDSRSRPLVEIYTAGGKLLAANRNYSGDDALADALLPADGDYLVRVSEFTYTFIVNTTAVAYQYRLTVTTHPWIDAVFPPMVLPGKPTPITVYGRNLPGAKKPSPYKLQGRDLEELTVTVNAKMEPSKLAAGFRVDPRSAELDGFPYTLSGPEGSSNAFPLFLAGDEVILGKDDNSSPEKAQEIPVGCEVAGRLAKRGERDWYRFAAKKGQTVWIDLYGDRLDCSASGISSFMNLMVKKADPQAGELVGPEDNLDTLSANHFYTRSGDPRSARVAIPDDGQYLVQVSGLDPNHFGVKANYRLCLSAGKPDFRAIAIAPATAGATPATLRLGKAGRACLEVYIIRRHGFKEAVALSAEGLPPGIECPPQIVGTHQVQGALVFAAGPNAPEFTGPIRVSAVASIGGKELRREVRFATVVWAGQPNLPNLPLIARLDQQCMLAVRDEADPFQIRIDTAGIFIRKEEKLPMPIVVRPGDKLTVPFAVARTWPDAKVPVNAIFNASLRNIQSMPNGQSPLQFANGQAALTIPADKADGTFALEVRSTAPAGSYPVVLKATAQVPYDKNPDGKNKKPATFTAISNPITVKVLPASLGRIAINAEGAAHAGKEYKITAKVTRENDYAGEYRLKIVLPMNAKGIEAKEATIPAGIDEVQIILTVAGDAPAASYANIPVVAVAKFENEYEVKSEAKFNLQVQK